MLFQAVWNAVSVPPRPPLTVVVVETGRGEDRPDPPPQAARAAAERASARTTVPKDSGVHAPASQPNLRRSLDAQLQRSL